MTKIIVICGPTAVGKTNLSFKLAKKFSGEIISADSRQIYKFMNIGTAKPKSDILAKIPHHLIDIKNPDEKYTAGDFAKDADKKIAEICDREHIPFIVGGTGFYIKSLLYGLCKTPKIPAKIRNDLRKKISEKGSSYYYEELKKVDTITAEKIHTNDSKRIIRALEIYQYTGKPLSEYWKEFKRQKRYEHFTIYLIDDRKKLYRKINERIDKMIKEGLLNEVKKLIKMGYSEKSIGMNTLGYKEFLAYLNKKLDWDTTVNLIKQHMRNYAKRQFTWFSKSEINLTIVASNINLFDIEEKISIFLGKKIC
ncbi:MAG: tRNA (adenosine(37)-N6)-dimethylallyltransferase MiaA [Candidatus Cloacimonetes bacterium]|nr:tRNA (adenosine(37)-N6)-dimethylallyltransferase MiaA [Candidatus Cloacimonadota bacterium]MBL7086151.1 tRNA (adenosine(37)-N6)-dimethylallyltransferase MiaA [Candidatus Cloacimonadota bacterium]